MFLSMVTAILKAFYQPLAGGLLSVTPVNRVQRTSGPIDTTSRDPG